MKKDTDWLLENIDNNISFTLDHRFGLMDGQYIEVYKLKQLIKQMDKSTAPKPTLPDFVSEWVDYNKQPITSYYHETEEMNEATALGDSIHATIKNLFNNDMHSNISHKNQINKRLIKDWINEDKRNYFKLVDAVRYGYKLDE